MSQAGYTPIQLYYSTTAAATPSAGNLAAGELAVNITDGKLFYKDNGGVVRVLATAAGSAGDVVGPGSSTDNALVRFDGTTGKLVQNSAGVLDDSGNLTGIAALTTSGALTLNGGTANGVAYLNGSKVLTTGSALTFDGTNLATTGGLSLGSANNLTWGGVYGANIPTIAGASNTLQFYPAGSTSGEQMRLTSTGLGIGTSSPFAKLQVVASSADYFNPQVMLGEASNATGKQLHIGYNTTANTGYIQAVHNGSGYKDLILQPNGGNLGLGVTPSAFSAGYVGFQMGGNPVIASQNNLSLAGNAFFNSGWKYIASNFASRYDSNFNNGGIHAWFTAPSGTAGNAISFTQAMTLDASGNLGVGITNPNFVGGYTNFVVSNASNGGIVYVDRVGGARGYFYANGTTSVTLGNTSSIPLIFETNNTERARIDSSGNLLVGTTSSFSTWRATIQAAGNEALGAVVSNVSSFPYVAWNQATSGDNVFVGFFTEGTITNRGSISYNRGLGLVAYNTTSDRRAKDILGPITNSGETIDAIQVHIGQMHGATQSRPMFIADELQGPAPYCVMGEKNAVNEKGEPVFQQVDHSPLIPLLVAEIQSLRKRLAAAGIA